MIFTILTKKKLFLDNFWKNVRVRVLAQKLVLGSVRYQNLYGVRASADKNPHTLTEMLSILSISNRGKEILYTKSSTVIWIDNSIWKLVQDMPRSSVDIVKMFVKFLMSKLC